ncbi:MAG: S9 family peptidase [Acidobacteriia bacterium]|nr:S9 family peptidase [Terriglobia bacterium]
MQVWANRSSVRFAIVAASLAAAIPGVAQQRFSAADYARAEKSLGYNTTPLVFGSGVRPAWLPDGRFWYRNTTARGSEFVLVDPAKGTRQPAFDHSRLAGTLSLAAGTVYEPTRLPFTELEFSVDGQSVTVTAGRRWKCDVEGRKCVAENSPAPATGGRSGRGGSGGGGRNESISPDRKRAVFIRENNLWNRDVATGKETQLTKDGVKDFGYATDNAGWSGSERPIVLWSPDSKKVATFQQDQRGVGEMYLVDTKVGHPTLRAWKYPLPGDEVVTTIQRVIVDVDDPHVVRFQMPADQHRSTLCDNVACRGEWGDVQWNPDGSSVAFVSTSRDHKVEKLRIANALTGAVRDVLEEKVSTFFESGNGRVDWRYLPASKEAIWFSERDNWGQLYLYDLETGGLKNQITTGEGNVTQLLKVDERNRVLYFLGVGREKGRDPYLVHLYRVGFDGRDVRLLTPEDATHEVTFSPSGRFFVDSYSKPDVPAVAVLRDSDGKLIATLEKADISKLAATGWKPPVPFTVKARDGVTDLYGLMFTPSNFDAGKKYPIVNHIYPGPQTGSVGSRAFSAGRADCQALAELGFIVIELDGMGTPWRSKKFHEAYFGNMGDNTLPDQVAGMKELAQRYPWIDIDRAGIYGHSGGGYATADAMFRYPDFFKVGISEAGNHDNRVYEDDWAEKWQGLLEQKPDGATNYDNQANQLIAKNLKGHLLLAHGTMDNNVPPYNTLLVVNELIKANKDFDLILLPNRSHGFGNEPYMIRRRWDYFVRYLLGAEPPQGYELHPPAGGRGGTPRTTEEQN